jgi:hypothetical protein
MTCAGEWPGERKCEKKLEERRGREGHVQTGIRKTQKRTRAPSLFGQRSLGQERTRGDLWLNGASLS